MFSFKNIKKISPAPLESSINTTANNHNQPTLKQIYNILNSIEKQYRNNILLPALKVVRPNPKQPMFAHFIYGI